MSVITNYKTTGRDNNNNPVNLRDRLVALGVVQMTDATHGELDLAKADPSGWAKELKEIIKIGVISFGNPYSDLNPDSTIKDEALTGYLRKFREVPPEPDGRKVYCYSIKDGLIHEVSRNRDFDFNSIEEKPLTVKETAKLRQEAIDYIRSYKLLPDGVYRRDYLPIEVERLSHPPVGFSEDGTCMSYIRNYNNSDFAPVYYTSRALSDVVLECTSYTEGELNSHDYIKNGEITSPSGKECHDSTRNDEPDLEER